MTGLAWGVLQILIGLFLLSILVFVHEFGHFLLARMTGVRVLVFSIGFGRKLARFQRGGTEYCVSALPFGGYVKLAGQDTDGEEDFGEGDFRNKKIWQRSAVVTAGPLANYLFAILALWVLFMAGVRERPFSSSMVVGGLADSSAGAMAGVSIGDQIISLNGKRVSSWENFYSVIMVSGGQTLSLEFEHKGKVMVREMTPKKVDVEGMGRFGECGIYSVEKPAIGQVMEPSAAQKAGLLAGDTIIGINGQAIFSWGQVVALVGKMESPGTFRVKRGNRIFDAAIRPEYNAGERRYMIGVAKATAEQVLRRYGPADAFVKSFQASREMITTMGAAVKGLIAKSISPKSLAGPVGIVQMTGNAARLGIGTLIFFLAMLSVNLAVINLLPLAITDGGVLLFLFLEKLRGKPFSKKFQMRVQQAALFFFIALFLFVTFNDLQRFPKFLSR